MKPAKEGIGMTRACEGTGQSMVHGGGVGRIFPLSKKVIGDWGAVLTYVCCFAITGTSAVW